MDFKTQLKRIRENSGLTQDELADKINRIHNTKLTRSTISRWEAGLQDASMAYVSILADFFGVTLDEMNGKSDFRSGHENIEPMPRFKSVPLIGTIACGAPITAQENVEDDIPLPDYIHADFCLICKGDSMINARIFDGDIVFIKQQPQVENGEVAAVLIDEEATLKRVFKLPHSMVELRAENPTYPSIYINGVNTQNIKIIGKAVHFLSKVK